MTARGQQVSSPEGRAQALGDSHEQGTLDAVQEAEQRHPRRPPVRETKLQTETAVVRAALARVIDVRGPRGRLEVVRRLASTLSCTAGEGLRGESNERELRLAEDDVIAAIYARRSA